MFSVKRNAGKLYSKNSLLFIQSCFLFSFFYLLSFGLLFFYTNGDQIHYNKFYEQVSKLDFFEAYFRARGVIGASEPVSIFLLWLGSSIDIIKNYYISFWNSILLLLLWLFCKKNNVRPLVFILIIFNFYILVLLTGAERLKFGYIFLFLIPFLPRWTKPFGAIVSGLAHFQMFLLFPSIIIVRNFRHISRIFKYGLISKSFLFLIFSSIVFFLVLFLAVGDAISDKFFAYFNKAGNFSSLTNLFLLTIVALLSTSNWKRMLASILPFYPLVFVLGGERVNILSVTIVVWMLIEERRIEHPISLALLIYFFVKSSGFIYNIIIFGNGFHS